MSDLATRLWAKADRPVDGCWLWRGATVPKGYGKIISSRRIVYAHRVAWELTYGPIPTDMLVLHTCDQPGCIRPDHLFLGSPADNSQDMKRKGRQPTGANTQWALDPDSTRGERNPMAKLTPDIIAVMHEYRSTTGASYAAIGRRFGITASGAHYAMTGRNWRHLSPPGLRASIPT